jgi:hypothetical protein
MDVKRRKYISEAEAEIARLKNIIHRDEDIIRNLSGLNIASDIKEKKMSVLTTSIQAKKDEIKNLTLKIEEYRCGELDEKINSEMAEAQKAAIKSSSEAIKKKHKTKVDEEAKVQAYYNKPRTNGDRNLEKDSMYSLSYYMKCMDTIPDYMKENLKQMPCNKGYIWRGCYLSGSLPPERNQPSIMFEKGRDGLMTIHEWTPTLYSKYEKWGKDKKVLVETQTRRIIKHNPL